MAGIGAAPPGREQVERPVQASLQVDQRQGAQPARGQLECQRQAVEPPHDIAHQRGVVAREHQVGLAPAGMREEGLDRGHAGHVRGALFGHGQRAEAQQVLGGQAQRLAGRRQHGQARAGRDERGGDIADRFDDVLAVVEHQHRVAAGQGVARGGQHLVVAPGA